MRWIALVVVAGCHSTGNAALDAKFKGARDSVKIGDSWKATTDRLARELGPPPYHSDTEQRWAAVDRDDCYDVRVLRTAGSPRVIGVEGGHVNSAVPDRFERCKAIAETPVTSPSGTSPHGM
ncbi:MAG TPA: hypothetical protein VLX92_20605 [Kofleriaceae bacterium]|nr:hypothetical protein [Kofleriaceae bacterium]